MLYLDSGGVSRVEEEMTDSAWMWIEIGCTVFIPMLTMWFGPDLFGPNAALLLGLSAPLLFLLANLRREGRVSPLSALSIASVVLTGVVGLLSLDARWFAIKEAALPVLMGGSLAATARTRFAVVTALFERILDQEKLLASVATPSARAAYDAATSQATLGIGIVTALSGALSFFLAQLLVTEPSGTERFVEQLGTYTAWSYPAVSLPVLIVTGVVLNRSLSGIERATGMPIDQLMRR